MVRARVSSSAYPMHLSYASIYTAWKGMESSIRERLSRVWIDERRRLAGTRALAKTTKRTPTRKQGSKPLSTEEYWKDIRALTEMVKAEETAEPSPADPAYQLVERTHNLRHEKRRSNEQYTTLKEYLTAFPFMTSWRLVCYS